MTIDLSSKKRKIRDEICSIQNTWMLSFNRCIESNASNLVDIIEEILSSTKSERQGRAIDHDRSSSMEQKKRQGYF